MYKLAKKVSGTYTQVVTSAVVPANGDVLRVEFSGSSIVGKVNGTIVASTTDSTFSTATKHGVRHGTVGTGTFDNFSHTS